MIMRYTCGCTRRTLRRVYGVSADLTWSLLMDEYLALSRSMNRYRNIASFRHIRPQGVENRASRPLSRT